MYADGVVHAPESQECGGLALIELSWMERVQDKKHNIPSFSPKLELILLKCNFSFPH